MIAVTASAHCLRCDWTAEGDLAETDKAAEQHVQPGHPTATVTVPAERRAA